MERYVHIADCVPYWAGPGSEAQARKLGVDAHVVNTV